jgi:hypothetical protein
MCCGGHGSCLRLSVDGNANREGKFESSLLPPEPTAEQPAADV